MAKASTDALKVRKKKWFQVIAPTLFREAVIGEVPLYESDALNKRKMGVNMMNLTGNPKNQSITVKLRIFEVKDGKGKTELLGFETMPSAIRRLIRRGRSKIDDSFVIKTSDAKFVRIKPLIITSTKVPKSVETALRRVSRNAIARLSQKLTYEKLAEEVITFKLQKHVQGLCTKITPVRTAEIKAFLLIEKPGAKAIVPGNDVDFPVKEEETFDDEESAAEKTSEESAENSEEAEKTDAE